jgi:hypothetical protein
LRWNPETGDEVPRICKVRDAFSAPCSSTKEAR